MTISDAGSILFPSMTICKDEMFDNLKSLERGLLTEYEKVSSEMAESWFRNRTFSRARLVKFLSIKTVEGSDNNNYPCNTVSGPRAGDPCSFPYLFPDCNLTKKPKRCESEPGTARVEYRGCYREDTDSRWCYTKTYHNRSHITGEWGYCSHHCSLQTVRSV